MAKSKVHVGKKRQRQRKVGFVPLVVAEAGPGLSIEQNRMVKAFGSGLTREAPLQSIRHVDSEQLRSGIVDTLEELRSILADGGVESVGGWRLNAIHVSLGVSAEGGIGIVTAGAQASIELSFERDSV